MSCVQDEFALSCIFSDKCDISVIINSKYLLKTGQGKSADISK